MENKKKQVHHQWKQEDITKLIKLYPDNSNEFLSSILNRTPINIQSKANRIGLKKSYDYLCKQGVRPWTDNEKQTLIESYNSNKSPSEISLLLNRNKTSIYSVACNLGITKPPQSEFEKREWSKDEIEKLTKLYADNSNKSISKILNRSDKSIQKKASNLGLEKSPESLYGIKRWTEEKVQQLIELYPNTYNKDLAIILNRSISNISQKANELGLQKSKEHLNKPRPWRIKPKKEKQRIRRRSEVKGQKLDRIPLMEKGKTTLSLSIGKNIVNKINKLKLNHSKTINKLLLDYLDSNTIIYNDGENNLQTYKKTTITAIVDIDIINRMEELGINKRHLVNNLLIDFLKIDGFKLNIKSKAWLKRKNIDELVQEMKLYNIYFDNKTNIWYGFRECPTCKKQLTYTVKNKTDKDFKYILYSIRSAECDNSGCISCSISGEKNYAFGKPVSEERKKEFSISIMGDKNPMKNPETAKKTSETLIRRYASGELDHVKKQASERGKLMNLTRIQLPESKKEKLMVELFKQLGYKTQTQFHINTRSYDLFLTEYNVLIEFNGDYWHCNPVKYSSDYFHQVKQMFAHELWKQDKYKKELAENSGYKFFVIWEKDFDKNKQQEINKIITQL